MFDVYDLRTNIMKSIFTMMYRIFKGNSTNQSTICGFGYSQCGVCFGPREEWPDVDEETLIDIQEEIADKLNEYVPDGCYFGAHEGDGSDFGVWDVSPEFEEYDADACSVLR